MEYYISSYHIHYLYIYFILFWFGTQQWLGITLGSVFKYYSWQCSEDYLGVPTIEPTRFSCMRKVPFPLYDPCKPHYFLDHCIDWVTPGCSQGLLLPVCSRITLSNYNYSRSNTELGTEPRSVSCKASASLLTIPSL